MQPAKCHDPKNQKEAKKESSQDIEDTHIAPPPAWGNKVVKK